jgi:hypothetical protein
MRIAATARAQLVMVLATLAMTVVTVPSSARACVVGNGTSASCTDTTLDACLPGGGSFDGTVTFNCGGAPKTIIITTAKAINADTTIDGGGLITISGGNSVDVFHVTADSFTVQNLTITKSKKDGIDNDGSGTTNATNCTISGNGHEGVANNDSGTANATNCTISDNNNSGIANHSSSGTTNATNCTISGNGSEGIVNRKGTTNATNCTVFGNSSGGVGNNSGTVTVTNCTIIGNDSIFNDTGATMTVTNTIMANNTPSNCVGTITDGGHNLQFPGTTCGATITAADPQLDPAGLKSNGGPTQTIALLAGSPAIDQGDTSVCVAPPVNDVDQRGVPRKTLSDPLCDIGAFEFNGGPRLAPAPTLSPLGLFTLAALLGATGWLTVRRGKSRR